MKLELSAFEDKYLEAIRLCGIIRPEENADLESFAPNESQSVSSSRETAGGLVWLRFIVNKQEDPEGVHFHLDAVTAASFGAESPDDIVQSADEFDRLIDPFVGKQVDYFGRTQFCVNREELASDNVVNLLLEVTAGAGDTGARLSGARYTLEGERGTLHWSAVNRESHECIRARINLDGDAPVGPALLNTIWEPASDAFKAVILEGGTTSHEEDE